jgi:hypothetical protein
MVQATGETPMKLFATRNAGNAEAKNSKLFMIFVFLAMVGCFVANRLAGFKAGSRRKSQAARSVPGLKIEN